MRWDDGFGVGRFGWPVVLDSPVWDRGLERHQGDGHGCYEVVHVFVALNFTRGKDCGDTGVQEIQSNGLGQMRKRRALS